MDNNPVPERKQRRKRNEPRVCKYVFLDGEEGTAGTRHGILLDATNSYQRSLYCKEHHDLLSRRAAQTEDGRAANIRRIKEYHQRHPEVVKRNKQASAARRARGEPKHPTRGRPPHTALPAPVVELAGAFKPAGSRKVHLVGPGTLSECRAWAAPAQLDTIAEDDPALCRTCLRNRQARRSFR